MIIHADGLYVMNGVSDASVIAFHMEGYASVDVDHQETRDISRHTHPARSVCFPFIQGNASVDKLFERTRRYRIGMYLCDCDTWAFHQNKGSTDRAGAWLGFSGAALASSKTTMKIMCGSKPP